MAGRRTVEQKDCQDCLKRSHHRHREGLSPRLSKRRSKEGLRPAAPHALCPPAAAPNATCAAWSAITLPVRMHCMPPEVSPQCLRCAARTNARHTESCTSVRLALRRVRVTILELHLLTLVELHHGPQGVLVSECVVDAENDEPTHRHPRIGQAFTGRDVLVPARLQGG